MEPPLLRDPRKADAEHLRILAILHYVFGGLGVLALGFLAAHWALLRFIFNNPGVWKEAPGGPPPAQFFAMFQWFYLVGAAFFLAGMALNFISARCLQQRRARTFSLVVAGLNCLVAPVGPILGVFTLMVLLRPSVFALYEGPASQEPGPAESSGTAPLRVLVVCHYIKGGLSLLNVAILVGQVALLPEFMMADPDAPAFLAPIFQAFFYVLGGFSLTLGILNLLSARALRLRRHRRFSQIVAGVNLLSVPLGTALGVYTFVVLGRDAVRSSYGLDATGRTTGSHA